MGACAFLKAGTYYFTSCALIKYTSVLKTANVLELDVTLYHYDSIWQWYMGCVTQKGPLCPESLL